MRAFVFVVDDGDDGRGLTHSYHNGGGAIVIAETVEDARREWNKCFANADTFSTDGRVGALDNVEPVAVFGVLDMPEKRVWVFPDAGCC